MMLREMMKAKIHGAMVTAKDLHYTGSLGIDADLMEEAGILPNEKIQVINLANGERMWTYAILSPRGDGQIVLNGGMAHKGEVGDRLLLITYVQVDEEGLAAHRPRVVLMAESNREWQVVEGGDS